MKPKKRQKLCHNCEGEIDIDVIVCPFCAADLREEKPELRYASYVSTSQHQVRKAPVDSLYPQTGDKITYESRSEDVEGQEDMGEEKKGTIFLPILLLTLGAQVLCFGLFMLLFSHKGALVLKWDARFWFFYVVGSLPFLIFGYRALSKL